MMGVSEVRSSRHVCDIHLLFPVPCACSACTEHVRQFTELLQTHVSDESLAVPEAHNGALLAFVNAFNHERSNHSIQTVQTIGEVLQRGIYHSRRFVDTALHTRDQGATSSGAAPNAAHVRSASITRSTSEGLGNFFHGFWSCPNGNQFGAIACSAGDRLRQVVSVNGQLALSGVNLDKQKRARLPDEQIRAIFNDMDRNGNGYIDTEEFQLLIQHLGLPASDAFLRCLLQYPLNMC